MATKKSAAKPAAKAAKPAAKAESKPAAKAESSKLGKTQMVDLLASRSGLSKKDAAHAFDTLGDILVEALRSGQTVGMPGLGTFSVTATAERQGVRPGTTERITIPAGKKVRFKVASPLKAAIGATE
ncbi:HU family DNA-binding protein [Deinococcus pimensis]|uniref:HU family DNA-binding protein n=1 Tax=Deinococcus pimensis TaxID=309888 RepID=UPI0004B2D875|nr:HU family DNA-binding protein [Deinococcus pimensis]